MWDTECNAQVQICHTYCNVAHESRLIRMRHVTHGATHQELCPTQEYVTSHIVQRSRSHVPHMNESWIMSHIRMRHVPHMNESWIMSHIWKYDVSQGATPKESCPTYKWVVNHVPHMTASCHAWCKAYGVMSHIRMSHESCPTYDCVMSRMVQRLRSHVLQKNTLWVT